MPPMRTGAVFLLLTLAVAACAPRHERMPRAAANWPESMRIQKLPQAQAPPAKTRAPAPPASQWVPRPVVADATEVPAQAYVVKPGDTLRRISDRTGASSEAIARANNIQPPFLIRIGERLKIPGGRYHRVKQGETGIAIARAYGVQWSRIIDANQLDEPYILRAGQKLLLPTAREVAAMSMEDRAKAFRIDIADLISGGEPAEDETPVRHPAKSPAGQQASAAAGKPVVAPSTFSGGFVWPVKGKVLSTFGAKSGGRFNDGINIKADLGEPVHAAADGVVAFAGDTIPGFGQLILIKHGDNWVTAYAHAQALLVSRGQTVKKGQVIARAGQTGAVDEPQVHFEIRQGRRPVDPLSRLPS